jgi:hypothetical protein
MAALLLLSPVAMLLVMVALDRWERRLDTDPQETDTGRHANS